MSCWGVRVDVNGEVKLLCVKIQKNKRGSGRGVRVVGGVGSGHWVGSGGGVGVRVDVNGEKINGGSGRGVRVVGGVGSGHWVGSGGGGGLGVRVDGNGEVKFL